MAAGTTQDTELVGSLVQLMYVLQDLYAETSRPLGLTPQQAHLLCVLLAGPLGMTELSRIMSIERSSLTSMVDRLERRSLVERLPDPADRRACRIALTGPGTELADQAHSAYTDRIAELTGNLPAGQRNAIVAAVATITRPPE
ncbi:transcriptional regulator, MarR family [Kribbella flavida DSM 17836]|uniref:Transcriptional regulator, MarR family n=1 Tax=Kribbella flavida (strain DSM 17836 / JCM 10339 / NBRC 14399) TaxID=479435 RepID=D2PVG7_KRIFD|nr:MarR family transcriptional regulator [Kribbella flavida]ADB35207.1 transcriptional regulator, MarR family [Kribbella flavida DSM 17836]